MRRNCKEHLAGKDDADRRLDRVIRILYPDLALSAIFRMLRNGQIRVNDSKRGPDYRLLENDRITIRLIQPDTRPNTLPKAQSGQVEQDYQAAHSQLMKITVMETADLLFVNKPQGMLTHGPDGLDCLAKSALASTAAQSLAFTPAPLHRLDRNTSGLLAISKTIQGARLFSAALRKNSVHKHYLAILDGCLPGTEVWEDGIQRDDTRRLSRIVEPEQGYKASLSIQPIALGQRHTLAQITLHTGRTHQIRTQCAARGFPLAGDRKYGSTSMVASGYLLHARSIRIEDAALLAAGLPAQISAPLPDFWRPVLESYFPDLAAESLFFA